VLFVVMGLVPLVIGLRADPRELFLGTVNVAGIAFARLEGARRSFQSFRFRGGPPEGEVVPTAQDWLTSIVLVIVSAGGGIYLANLLFASFGGSAA
jgi:hypothetical protein